MKNPDYSLLYNLKFESFQKPKNENSLHEEWTDYLSNLDYTSQVYSKPLGKSKLINNSTCESGDVVEFFKRNSYTDCVYSEEISYLLKEYSKIQEIYTSSGTSSGSSSGGSSNKNDQRDEKILSRLWMIKSHLDT